jgi:hypothetical protein
MDHGFAETQAMVKFSYAELDRRLTSAESNIDSLQRRVEKLEKHR